MMAFQTKHENLLNDTLFRMDRTDEKLEALQNQVISLQRQIDEIKSKPAIPPPPPPPPPPPMPHSFANAHKLKDGKTLKSSEQSDWNRLEPSDSKKQR